MAQIPGRVFPGKRMAGHLGDVSRTIQLLEIVRIDAERQLHHGEGLGARAPKSCAVVRAPASRRRCQ